MKLSWFLLGLITGLTLTAFATPPVRKPKAQPIRGYRPPEPMATPVAGRVVVEKITDPLLSDIHQGTIDLVKDMNAGRTSLRMVLEQNKAMEAMIFND